MASGDPRLDENLKWVTKKDFSRYVGKDREWYGQVQRQRDSTRCSVPGAGMVHRTVLSVNVVYTGTGNSKTDVLTVPVLYPCNL